MVCLVEVELNSAECDHIIKWYARIFGSGERKATIEDIRILSKIETMRDAYLTDEDAFEKLTK